MSRANEMLQCPECQTEYASTHVLCPDCDLRLVEPDRPEGHWARPIPYIVGGILIGLWLSWNSDLPLAYGALFGLIGGPVYFAVMLDKRSRKNAITHVSLSLALSLVAAYFSNLLVLPVVVAVYVMIRAIFENFGERESYAPGGGDLDASNSEVEGDGGGGDGGGFEFPDINIDGG